MELEKVLPLNVPVKVGDVEYASLTLTEPTAAQLSKAEKAGTAIDQLITLIHLNAKVPRQAVEQLRQRDLDAAGNFFGDIGTPVPQTSETSSPS